MPSSVERLYIASTEPAAGKTVLAAALLRRAQAQGRRTAYLKPLRVAAPSDADAPDLDASFIAQTLQLALDPTSLVGQTTGAPEAPVAAARPDGARAALDRIDHATDLVLLEGLSGPLGGDDLAAADAALASALDAKVVLVAWYREYEFGEGDIEPLRHAAAAFGDRLAGIVVNGIPQLRRHHLEARVLPALRAAGLPIVAVLPQRRVLSAPTVRDVVAALDGQVIAFPEGLDELAERLMIGALALDGGLYYYGQAARKVVITRWDRPDLQMPALATGCQALICTGGQGPIPYVWDRVQELRVPVAIVQGGSVSVASRLSDGVLAARGRPHLRKIEELDSLLAADAPALLALLTDAGAPTAR